MIAFNLYKWKTFEKSYLETETFKIKCKLLDDICKFIPLDQTINSLGDTLIHFVIANGQPFDIEYLYNKISPEQINIQNNIGETPLMQMAREGRQTIVSLLLLYRASLEIKDTVGRTATDYQTLSPKPVILAPSMIIHHLERIYKSLKSISNEQELLDLQDYLADHQISFNQGIDRDDNTIAFYVLQISTLDGMQAFLDHITYSILHSRNCKGQTPLHFLIEKNLYVKANILINAGAPLQYKDFSHRTPFECATRNNTPLHGNSISFYQTFYQLCERFNVHLDYEKLLNEIAQLGLRLDEGADELDNTPLHHLVKFLPYPAFEQILSKHTDCNLTCLNSMNLSIGDMAQREGSQSVLLLLKQRLYHQNSVSVGLPYPTVYQDLQSLFQVDHLPQDKDSEIVVKHFHTFVNYLKRNNYRYHGEVRDGNLLDGESGKGTVVNCHDLTIGFGFLLRMNGFKDISVYGYTDIKSRPFSDKGSLMGDYVCFDAVAHKHQFKQNGFFSFNAHYVLQVGTRFFDPTFSCHYDNAEDITYSSANHKIEDDKIMVNFYYQLAANRNKANFLGLKVSAFLMSHLSLKDWHHEYQHDFIRLQCHNKFLLIEVHDECISFAAKDFNRDELIIILNKWLEITNINYDSVHIETCSEADKEILYNSLTASQLATKPAIPRLNSV